MDQNKRTKFLSELFGWWEQNKRILPWRETKDPYKIMVSEFMLQQTQVNRVIDKYNIFVKKYSNLESLAKSKKIDFRAEINFLICGGCFDCGDSMRSESLSGDESTIKSG